MLALHQRRHTRRRTLAHALERAVDVGAWLEDHLDRPGLVARRIGKHFFEQVRERPVAEVVQQRCSESVATRLGVESLVDGDGVLHGADAVEQLAHHMRGPNGVRETRVFRARKDQRRQPELSHAPEPLHLPRREQWLDDLFALAFKGDQAVDGVTQDHGVLPDWVVPATVPKRASRGTRKSDRRAEVTATTSSCQSGMTGRSRASRCCTWW